MYWSNDLWLSYGPWTCSIFFQIFSCPDLFFTDVLWDIDLIFGMWLYLDELQLNFEFRSGRMIFSWVMALELFFSNFKLSGLFFHVLWNIDLIFGMWLYLDELQFKFEFRSGRMIFSWVMALELFCSNFKLSGFFWLASF